METLKSLYTSFPATGARPRLLQFSAWIFVALHGSTTKPEVPITRAELQFSHLSERWLIPS